VPLFPIIDLASMEPEDAGGGYKTEFMTLGGEDESILPVFTSMNRFWAFADDYLTGDDSIESSTFPIDPFRLAEIIEPWMEMGELGFLVFNPTAVSPGKFSSAREPIPAAHYCRFVGEIRPEIRRAARQAEAKFGPAIPGSAAEKKAMEWLGPRLEGLADSAGARVDEWWESRDARG
jgi:hypothetical protein